MAPCNLCNNFQRRARDYRVNFDFEPDQLDTLVQSGCPYCSLIRNGIARFEPKVGPFTNLQRGFARGYTVDGNDVGTVEVDLIWDDSIKLTLDIFVGIGQ